MATCAIWCRVSKTEQETANQLEELRQWAHFNHLLPVGIGRPQAATARRWHLCAWPGYHRHLTTNTVQEG